MMRVTMLNTVIRRQRPAGKFVPKPRFVALLDILGMRNWLARAPLAEIADVVDGAIGPEVLSQASSSLELVKGEALQRGPFVGTTHFSDTILAWTYDDSWGSLSMLANTICNIMREAGSKSVPIRGAISVGEMVCHVPALRFVGRPIAEAYEWDTTGCPYRGMGVSLTPCAVKWLGEQVPQQAIPDLYLDEFDGCTFLDQRSSKLVHWHDGLCFVDHWPAFASLGTPVEQRISNILTRPEVLPEDCKGRKKVELACDQTLSFFRSSEEKQRAMSPANREDPVADGMIAEIGELNAAGRHADARAVSARLFEALNVKMEAKADALSQEMTRLEAVRRDEVAAWKGQ